MRLPPYCAIEDELLAYADGVLPACRRPMVESYLGALPEEQRRIESYRRLNIELHRMYDRPDFESIPRSYGFLASELARAIRRQRRTRRLACGGAALFIAIAAAMTTWAVYDLYGDPPQPLAALTRQAADARFTAVGNDAGALELRAGENGDASVRRRPGQFTALPPRAPDLARLGFELTGSKVVATSAGPAVHLQYRGVDKRQMRLLIEPANSIHKTAFTILEDSDASLVSWQVGPLTYNLVGNIDRGRLLDLARAVSTSMLPDERGDHRTPTSPAMPPKSTPIAASPAAAESPLEGATVRFNTPAATGGDVPSAAPPLPSTAPSPSMAPDAVVRNPGLKPPTQN